MAKNVMAPLDPRQPEFKGRQKRLDLAKPDVSEMAGGDPASSFFGSTPSSTDRGIEAPDISSSRSGSSRSTSMRGTTRWGSRLRSAGTGVRTTS